MDGMSPQISKLTSLQPYEEIIDFCNKTDYCIPEGFLRQMILSYVAGAYAHLNNLEEAKRYFIAANDLNGLLECDQRYNGRMSRVEQMELLYERLVGLEVDPVVGVGLALLRGIALTRIRPEKDQGLGRVIPEFTVDQDLERREREDQQITVISRMLKLCVVVDSVLMGKIVA